MKWPERLFFIVSSMVLSLTTACGNPGAASTPGNMTVTIAVTRDFGREVLLERSLELASGTSAMAALKQVTAVETSYGGGFVNAINGDRSSSTGLSGDRQDWFFGVNGIASNTGALDYVLRPGDIEQWDFHVWRFQQTAPATVGHFPEPFLHGHRGNIRPTIVVYADDFEKEALSLKEQLENLGVVNASIRKINVLAEPEKESANLIILGRPNNPLAAEINREWQRLGLFARFENNSLITLNSSGEVAETCASDAGVILATQNPWNPNGTGAGENVVWLVSGTDEGGVKAAADVLLNHAAEIRYAYAATVSAGKVTRLPR